MNIRKYTAATMEAALEQVRTDLGRDAVILHTRCFRRGTVLGWGGRQLVEVTASNDVNIPPRNPSASLRHAPAERAYRNALSGSSSDFLALKSDVSCLRNMLEDLLRHTRPSRVSLWPEPLRHWHQFLVKKGASEAAAQEVLEPLAAKAFPKGNNEPSTLVPAVLGRIAECIRSADPIAAGKPDDPSVVAFVGPTGVGKTTTIAKLAAHFALRERQPVGLITLDTYRIAAVEQLRTYARIIEVPLEVVLSPSELGEAVDRLSGCSIILVDTAGRSQRDRLKINDLKGFFERRRPTQTHLVLSATSDQGAVADTLEKFSIYEPNSIVLTKLDELPATGRLLDSIRIMDKPISYVTTGQDVPDDIDVARPQRLAELIAGEEDLDR
jgi:flagellar biosynthesis protein FlhF